MSGIRKIHPTDTDTLRYLYGIITDSNNRLYKDITWDKFLECSDNVFVYIDKCFYHDQYPILDCVIACRRTNMDDIKLEKLEYYCKPYKIVYSIEVLHIIENHDEKKLANIVFQLVDAVCMDKNDAFICLRISSPEGEMYKYIEGLLSINFTIDSFDKSKGVYTLIRKPLVG